MPIGIVQEDLVKASVFTTSVVASVNQTNVSATALAQGAKGEDGSGDLHFEQSFSPALSLTVNHNLGKEPAVTVVDSAGTELIADVTHININQLSLSFNAEFGGKVICN